MSETGPNKEPALHPDDRAEILAAARHAPEPRGAAIEALLRVQRRSGWLDDQRLEALAALLGMSPHEVESLATFYNHLLRRPVGRHVILLCDSVSCHLMGHPELERALLFRLQVELGQTTADGRFTVLPVACLGACDRAPVLMIDEDLHTGVTPDGLPGILEGYP